MKYAFQRTGEGKAERALEAVRAMLASRATVVRDGERHVIDAAGLVPGDIVILESGASRWRWPSPSSRRSSESCAARCVRRASRWSRGCCCCASSMSAC